MNRGRRAERIFNEEDDYAMFVELLKEASEAWSIRICAYCLMPNYYHLLVQTPEANISRAMRHINGIYTQRFNRRHGCDGQLFRGRYKSIVVDADSYLLQLVRYIHSNPAKAGIAPMDRYQWSSLLRSRTSWGVSRMLAILHPPSARLCSFFAGPSPQICCRRGRRPLFSV